MSTISKNNIETNKIIEAEHLLRIIEALDGTATIDIIIKGKFDLGEGKLAVGTVTVTTTGEELNRLAGVTPGTTVAGKALVVDDDSKLHHLKVQQLVVNELIQVGGDTGGVGDALYLFEHNI